MKNLFLLPTDKPSRLSILNSCKLNFGAEIMSSSNSKPQHIYITSDEEIKEGDAVIHDFGMGYELENPCDSDNLKSNTRSKIILTTDQDLIEDGVQAIDNDFLEWFVKNPSCEFVEWSSEKIEGSFDGEYWKFNYGTVIPQEEPKQETLEEAALSFLPHSEVEHDTDFITGFEFGANWQAKRMYSEEEVEKIISKLMNEVHSGDICYGDKIIDFKISPKKWFEQFKKK